jgi:transcriptional regulator with PAS, ATPase and Fis domain
MHTGRFEIAAGGSIFLDEISEMSPNLQVKLLRVLQEKEFERVGGINTIKANVRIIAATNKNLEEEVDKGHFREDLYYRLNVIPIILPPLRERPDDIPALIKFFIEKNVKEKSMEAIEINTQVMQHLMNYRWPGNVRELENLIERLSVLCNGNPVTTEDLPEKILSGQVRGSGASLDFILPDEGIDLSDVVSDFEKNIIIQALKKSGWIKNRAAKLLNLNRTTLVEKIKKQGIQY